MAWARAPVRRIRRRPGRRRRVPARALARAPVRERRARAAVWAASAAFPSGASAGSGVRATAAVAAMAAPAPVTAAMAAMVALRSISSSSPTTSTCLLRNGWRSSSCWRCSSSPVPTGGSIRPSTFTPRTSGASSSSLSCCRCSSFSGCAPSSTRRAPRK